MVLLGKVVHGIGPFVRLHHRKNEGLDFQHNILKVGA
jgi:hypothetical protein